jgi:hypothetical protein
MPLKMAWSVLININLRYENSAGAKKDWGVKNV